MTKFIVHIGDGKCGSSSIQKSLYEAREKLSDLGIIYETSNPNNGHFDFVELAGKNTRSSSEASLLKVRETLIKISESLQTNSTVILSAESFFGMQPDDLIKILEMISPNIEQLDIIAYVRAPHSMYLSLMQQTVKANSIFPMPNQYARPINKILKRWQSCPEVDSLTLRNFDRSQLVGGDVVSDFTQALKGLTGGTDIALPSANVNTTLSAEQLVILQKYRGIFLKDHDGKSHKDSQIIISYFEKLNELGFPGSKPELTESALFSLNHGNVEIVRSLNHMFPTLIMKLPVVSMPNSKMTVWEPDGSIEKILNRIDKKLLLTTENLVSKFHKSVTYSDIFELTISLRAISEEQSIEYGNILKETILFWRQMKLNDRADLLYNIATGNDENHAAVGPSAPKQHPMILYGKGDWMFLKSDSNRVLEQIAGIYPLKIGFKESWSSLFEHRAEMAKKIGYKYFYGVAPNKECVYADQLPNDIIVSEKRPINDVLDSAKGKIIFRYYLDSLLAARALGEDVFITGDTHWNHIGALTAFNEAARAMCLTELHEDMFIRETRQIKADLSMKVGQLCPATVLKVSEPQFRIVADNKVSNIGHCRIYENEDKTLPRCVFFRDSFTSHQLEMFASVFSRIVFLWQPNIDYNIVKAESPDFVINQQVERFLVDCPDDLHDPSHAEYVRRKTIIS